MTFDFFLKHKLSQNGIIENFSKKIENDLALASTTRQTRNIHNTKWMRE